MQSHFKDRLFYFQNGNCKANMKLDQSSSVYLRRTWLRGEEKKRRSCESDSCRVSGRWRSAVLWHHADLWWSAADMQIPALPARVSCDITYFNITVHKKRCCGVSETAEPQVLQSENWGVFDWAKAACAGIVLYRIWGRHNLGNKAERVVVWVVQLHFKKVLKWIVFSRSEYDRTNQCPLRRNKAELQSGFICDINRKFWQLDAAKN